VVSYHGFDVKKLFVGLSLLDARDKLEKELEVNHGLCLLQLRTLITNLVSKKYKQQKLVKTIAENVACDKDEMTIISHELYYHFMERQK